MNLSTGLDFVALDVETANYQRGSICAVGLTVVRSGEIVRTHSWLCRPPELLGETWTNTWIHGIRREDVADKPRFSDLLVEALAVIGDLAVVAHNAAFDIGALREACSYSGISWPRLTYGCTMVMARRALDLPSNGLATVAAELAVPLGRHHDAGSDSLAAAGIALGLAQRTGTTTLNHLADHVGVLLGRLTPIDWSGCHRRPVTGVSVPLPGANPDADPNHPLCGAHVAFTGALSIVRHEVRERVAQLGGVPQDGVTRATAFLVIGDGFRGDDPADFFTGKAEKAARYRARGQSIEVLTEQDLMVLLADERMSGTAAMGTAPACV